MASGTIVQPTIFREYIGARLDSGLTDFPDIINPRVEEFHYILAFATEDYDETTKTGTGTFNPSWDLSVFNAQSIQNLKEKHKNVKVVISIGGRGSEYPFNPAEKLVWVDNAKKSLEKILNDFNKSCTCGINLIDGIDVNYEIIQSSEVDFVESIGMLIQGLKQGPLINVASIAPSISTRPQYLNLYQTYGAHIDWVNYQFYNQNVPNRQGFENLFNNLSRDYPNEILLAGFSTVPNDNGGITREVFLEGCQHLFQRKLLRGIFVWDADNSKAPTHGNPFQVENLAQQMIADFNRATN